MTTLAWAVPLGIAVVGLVPVVLMLARVADEATRLAAEMRRLGDLRPALVELRRDAAALRPR